MKLNKYAKIIFIFGSILTVLALTASAVCGILAGKAGNYYLLMSFSEDFNVLTRQYAGLTALGCIILQVICKTEQNETE